MNPKSGHVVILVWAFFAATGAIADPNSIEQLDSYRQQGIEQVDAGRGKRLWYASVDERGCTSCHGDQPVNIGKHVKTGKSIEPMAASLSSTRYRSAKKIEKWFLRNCKWTFGRECSLQEKADILTWLARQ